MIKQAFGKDIRRVTEMARHFSEHTAHVLVDVDHATSMYEGLIGSGEGVMFYTEKDGDVIGGIGGICGPDLHFPRTMAVETFWFVLPEHRGIGMKLLDRFEGWAKEKKCDCVALVHLSDSYPDILEKLYSRRGYLLAEKHYLKEVGA